MKLLKKLCKTAFVVTAVTYAVCLINGITVIGYTATSEGGTVTIAGHSVEVNSGIAGAFHETYSKVEKQASKLLPKKIKTAVEQVCDLIDGSD